MSPEKRVDRAIEIARRSGMPLKIAAKIYPEERRLTTWRSIAASSRTSEAEKSREMWCDGHDTDRCE
jgi:hypothetical protein